MNDIVYTVCSCDAGGECCFFATIHLEKAIEEYKKHPVSKFHYYRIEKYVDGKYVELIEENKPFRWEFG